MNVKKQFYEGLLTQNPVLVQLLGMCSTLAITTTLFNGIGMGISVLVILTCSNIFISLLRNVIPNKIRIACYIVVIATFVTLVDLLLQAFVPALADSLGVFIPLIVVNCIILGRAEAFASKNGIAAAAIDGIAQGVGYTIVLIILCFFRELLGNGTILGGLFEVNATGNLVFGLGTAGGIRVIPEGIPALGLILPVGGFLTLGVFIAVMQWALNRPKKAEKEGAAN
ncbi:MAG: electron transport complex subunit RsxE [Oscillospiraceae bacterium]|nr:electron transport complex subunit RsxE [Oscillospiraceae bacterium]